MCPPLWNVALSNTITCPGSSFGSKQVSLPYLENRSITWMPKPEGRPSGLGIQLQTPAVCLHRAHSSRKSFFSSEANFIQRS
jgi:hypothetical protein